MFGYIKPFTPELKIREDGVFKAHYCGVCKAIGKYSQCYRFALQYDCAFLSLMLGSLGEVSYTQERCAAHWLNKRKAARGDTVVYSAVVNVLLAYYKLKDDWRDDRNALKGLLSLMSYRVGSRVERDYKALFSETHDWLYRLNSLEAGGCDSPDEVAECFGRLLEGVILCAPCEAVLNYKKQLCEIFFNIGRWLYLIDALDDYSRDETKNQYNVLILKYKSLQAAAYAMKDSLEYTLSLAACAYERIGGIKNKGLLDNFFYGGLPDMTAKVLKENSNL